MTTQRGVRQFRNTWRGQSMGKTQYFPTEKEAAEFAKSNRVEAGYTEDLNVSLHSVKNVNALDQDLPIGIMQWPTVRKGVTYNALKTTMILDGKMVARTKAYGKRRSFEEALELIMEDRAELIRLKSLEKNNASNPAVTARK